MDGVTVLQTIPAFCEWVPVHLTVIIAIVAFFAIIICMVMIETLHPIIIMACITIFILTMAMGISSHPEQYKVILDDSVSYNEFVTHYNIIETDGEILIVEEK